jgi:two-component system, LuxR family, sensor kinase FixL
MKIAEAYQYLKLGIVVANGPELLIQDANERFYQKIGMLPDELRGKALSSLFLNFCLPVEHQPIELTLINGEKVEVNLTKVPKEDLYLITLQQISNNSVSIEEMQDKESRLQAVINTAVDGIITISKTGIVESMNPAAAKLFGYVPEEVLGNNIKMLMPEPDRTQHDGYLQNYRETEKRKIIGIGREVVARRKNGTTFPIHLSVSEVKLNNKIIYTGILHDLSAQKAAEEKVRRYATELERSNSELQDFAYVSSHDLQEPLRKIRAFGDRLKREADQLSEKGLDYLERMINAAVRMQHLINDLLSFSRVSTHAKSFHEVNLNDVISDVLVDLEYAIEQSQAKIEVDNLPVIEAEYIQMRQLFQNLIANALKFRKAEEPPHIKIYAKVMPRKSYHQSTVTGENLVKIFIEDNGIGFDEQYREKIFQIFQRLEGRKYEGSGIGLAICKRIATRHGGDIEAESVLEKGSTFIVTLPLVQPILTPIEM